jgi:hypothetical protein
MMNRQILWRTAVAGLLVVATFVPTGFVDYVKADVNNARFTCRTNELVPPVKNNLPFAGSIKVRKCWAPDGRGAYRVRWFAWFAPESGRSIGLEARVVRPGGTTRHHSAPVEDGARRSPRKGFHRLKGVNSIHFKACEVNAEGIFFNCTNFW